jgi:hypothetical protein
MPPAPPAALSQVLDATLAFFAAELAAAP